MILISGCLLGLRCRYDGERKTDTHWLHICAQETAITICSEQMGGLPTPRSPSEITGGDGFDVLDSKARVITEDDQDVTPNFIRGAEEVLYLATRYHPNRTVLKEKSPSCGVNRIYHGEDLINGCGVTTALLIRNGFSVESSDRKEL